MKNVLAVDIGSSSVKAGRISLQGSVLSSVRVRLDAAQPFPLCWFSAMQQAFSAALSGANGSGGTLPPPDCLVISGAGPTLVAADASGRVTASLMWDDPVPEISVPAGSRSSIFLPRLLAMQKLFPEETAHAARLFSGPEFAVFSLCGTAVSVLPDSRWQSAYWDDGMLVSAGFRGDLLPPFSAPGFLAGRFTGDPALPYAPLFSGILPDGIPVRAGPPDFAAALLGTGTVSPGRACDRAGSSEGLNVCTAQAEAAAGLRSLPSPVPGLWNLSYLLPETGKAFSRFRAASPVFRSLSYPEILRRIFDTPVIPPPGQEENPARAAAEQICRKVKQGVQALQSAVGFLPAFVLSGGQAKNPLWNQMKADITGAEFLLTQTADAELLGGAIIAFCADGEFSSYGEACAAMVKIKTRFSPDPARAALYAEKFAHS